MIILKINCACDISKQTFSSKICPIIYVMLDNIFITSFKIHISLIIKIVFILFKNLTIIGTIMFTNEF